MTHYYTTMHLHEKVHADHRLAFVADEGRSLQHYGTSWEKFVAYR